jgi:hypothetical protein
MLDRLQNLRPAIDLLTQRDPILQQQSLQLDDHDWSWIKRLSDTLEVFKEPTVALSGSNYPTLSKQYPRYRDISRQLANIQATYNQHGSEENATMWAAINAGWQKIDQYHRAADRSTPATIAVILDPTCKINCLQRMDWTRRQRETAEHEFRRVFRAQYAPGCGSHLDNQLQAEERRVAEASAITASGQRTQRRPMTAFEATFLEDPSPPPPAASRTDNFRRRFGGQRAVQEEEVDRYLDEGVQPYDVNELRSWYQTARFSNAR